MHALKAFAAPASKNRLIGGPADWWPDWWPDLEQGNDMEVWNGLSRVQKRKAFDGRSTRHRDRLLSELSGSLAGPRRAGQDYRQIHGRSGSVHAATGTARPLSRATIPASAAGIRTLPTVPRTFL